MRPTVLVVDDDPVVMDTTTDMFDLMGYDVLSADCPHMDGREFAAQARALRPDLKIIYTSGQPQGWAGIVFIPKPYTGALLADVVERALA